MKVHNDNTVDEKTSNEYTDDEFIDFHLVSTANYLSNLSSIHKNNINIYDITKTIEEKMIETVLVDSVPVSASGNYNKINLHLAETIDNTVAQFKTLIKNQENLLKIMSL